MCSSETWPGAAAAATGAYAKALPSRTAGMRAGGCAGRNRPIEFGVNAPGKLASALAAAAGGKKCVSPEFVFLQPCEELRERGVPAQPIEAQLDGLGLP